jgi:hypothetical protein
MRVVINEAQIKRNRQISHILFFASLAGMGIGLFYTMTTDPASQGNQLSCFILPLLLLMTLTSVRMANTWIREPRPVDTLEDGLKGLGKKYMIFHYLLPAPHVLIGPEGVFTLKTIWQEREYRIKGKKWSGDEGLVRKLNGYMRQDLIGNPFQDALFEAQQMQKLVDKIAPAAGIEVQPLVVLINPAATFEAEDPLFPVLYADSKKKPSLRNYLRDQANTDRATLSEEDLDRIDEMYGLVTRHEIAEMLGETVEVGDQDVAYDEEEADLEEMTAAAEDGELGTIFVAKAGQLFYIGVAEDLVGDEIDRLEEEMTQEVELVHTFEATDPAKVVTSLQKKYARKRQKDHWYGLSKKDIANLKSR